MTQTTILPTWQIVKETYVNTGPPRQYIGPIFCNSYTGAGPLAGVWQQVDLTAWGVASDAIAALLSGIIIITSGNAVADTEDLGVIFRAPGDNRISNQPADFMGQAVFALNSIGGQLNTGGQRTNMAVIVPVIGGKVEWCWFRSTQGQYPANASYGVNLSIHQWFR